MSRRRLSTAVLVCCAAWQWSCQRTDASGANSEHGSYASSESAAVPASVSHAARPAESDHAAHGHPAAPAAPAGEHSEHERPPGPAGAGAGHAAAIPPGYATITLDPERARAIGLRVAPVGERELSKRVRTTGTVVLDETRTSHVHAKVRGWVEKVAVDFVGKKVTAGAPLCTIYSQEVVAAQLEFLSILGQASNVAPLSGAMAQAETEARERLLDAARRRLALWDVPPAEIARLEQTREPRRTFTLDAPRSGIVVAKQALPGMFIDPSVELYLISDIRKLWVLADLYELDAQGVRIGDRASLSIEGLRERRLDAQVAFLPPTIDEATRTLKVRFNVDNAEEALRPGAFATVELNVELGRALSVPEAAVIHAGRQAIVFVAQGERIEPRSVELGPLVGDFYAVRAGLAQNDAVVVGAQFLIDSESRLRATTGAGPSHGGH